MTANTNGNQGLQTLPGESVQILNNIIHSNKTGYNYFPIKQL